MIHSFRKHTERINNHAEFIRAEAEKIKAKAAKMERELERRRDEAAVDLYLEAQSIKNPQLREFALSAVMPLIEQSAQKKSKPSGPHCG